MNKKYKKYPMGGMLEGKPHSRGGIPIEAAGGEFIIKKDSVNEETLPILEQINDSGDIPISNAMDRSEYYGGGMVDKMYEKGGMIPKAHKDHHSPKHIKAMKSDMKKGDSFKKAHNKALKKVGK